MRGYTWQKTVRIEIWKFWLLRFILHDEPGNWWRRDKVISSPAYCADCTSRLGKLRTIASILAIAPFLLVFGLAPPLQNNFFSFSFLFGYGFYLAFWGSYTWANRFLYGNRLKAELKEWIPETDGKVCFPVSVIQCIFRFVMFFGGGFLALVVRELFL